MKKMFTLGMVLALVCLGFSAKSQTEMTNQQKASYAIGHNVGNGMSHDGIELDYEAFVQGVKDAYAGTNKFTDEQMQEIFMQLQQDIQAKKQSGTAAEIAKGAQFLAENKKNPDVKETASGLQYMVLQEGKGEHRKPPARSPCTTRQAD